MIRGLPWALGAVAFLVLGSSPASAQSITGPGKGIKPVAPIDPDATYLGAAWSTWSPDELVAWLAYQPIKVMGLGGFEASKWPDVKLAVGRAEVSARTIAAAYGEGRVDAPTARVALQAVFAEYQRVLDGLAAR